MKHIFSPRILLVLASVAFLNIYFFRSWDGLGTVLLIALFYLLISLSNWKTLQHTLLQRWFLGYTAAIAIAAVIILTRANNFVQGLALLSAEFSLLLIWNVFQSGGKAVSSFGELVCTPFVALRNYIMSLAASLETSFKEAPETKKTPFSFKRIQSILLGIVISIPILIVVSSLLQAGDPIFRTTVSSISSNLHLFFDLSTQQNQRILFSLLWITLLIPFVQRRVGEEFISPLRGLSRFRLTTEFSVVVLLLAIVIGSFVVIQWRYIFASVAAETDLSTLGVATYSEYVTKGFSELLLVSLIIYSVVWVGLVLMRSTPHNSSGQWLKIFQLVLLGEFGVFLLSLFRRLWLYQSLHGMTVVRGFGAYLLLVISLFSITLAARHLFQTRFKWVHIEMGILIVTLILLGTFNIEHYIATSHPPTVNNRIDYVYLARMSPDGSEGWKRAFEYAQTTLNNPELDTVATISADQRREIAYAGYITNTLQLNYLRLVERYGSAQEINGLHDRKLAQTDQVYNKIIAHVVEHNLEASNSAALNNLKEEQEHFRSTRNTIALLDNQVPQKLHLSTSYIYFNPLRSCAYCIVTFFGNGNNTHELKTRPFDTTEQLLWYNSTEKSLFHQRDEIIPFETLLELENRYVDLRRRMLLQPQEEQNAHIDISLNTPFISEQW